MLARPMNEKPAILSGTDGGNRFSFAGDAATQQFPGSKDHANGGWEKGTTHVVHNKQHGQN